MSLDNDTTSGLKKPSNLRNFFSLTVDGINNGQTFISQILTFHGPLGEKLSFFNPKRSVGKSNFDHKSFKINLHSTRVSFRSCHIVSLGKQYDNYMLVYTYNNVICPSVNLTFHCFRKLSMTFGIKISYPV